MINPFYITGIIPEPYFCDRKQETEWLLRTLKNKAHVLLTSSRRMGKTQLIRHLYEQPEIKNNYHTFYIDIFPTTSLNEMVLFLSKEIYTVLVPKGKSAVDRFLSVLNSLSGSFGYNPVTATPSFTVKLGDIHQPELTLEEIFSYLENADKPCIFSIDEFQQIARYPQKNVEALLRSYIQQTNNCCFIYAGSNRHILEQMFYSASKPFYNSAEHMNLGRIDRTVYTDFALRQFLENERQASRGAIELAYDLFDGHTYYVHNLLHKAFAHCNPDKKLVKGSILKVLQDILEERENAFSATMSQLDYQQKETLIAVAKEGEASHVTSVAFIRKHALKSPSSVQYAIKKLLDLQLVTYRTEGKEKYYSVDDRFLGKWIVNTY